jgi:hypothetical protein
MAPRRRKPSDPDGWFAYPPPPRPPDHEWNVTGWARHSAARRLDPDVPVKLMPEYSVELPIWNYSWRDLGLEPSLLDALADWQAEFDAHFDPERGWTDDSVRARWAEESERLVARLRLALPSDVRLDVDLWPLSDF